MRFVINELGLLPAIQKLRGCEDTNKELVDAILEEAGKLAGGVLGGRVASKYHVLSKCGDIVQCLVDFTWSWFSRPGTLYCPDNSLSRGRVRVQQPLCQFFRLLVNKRTIAEVECLQRNSGIFSL